MLYMLQKWVQKKNLKAKYNNFHLHLNIFYYFNIFCRFKRFSKSPSIYLFDIDLKDQLTGQLI